MSLLFNAAADRVLRTTDLLNKNAAYSWGGYYKFSDVSGVQTLFSLNDNSGDYDFWGMINGVLYIETQGGNQSGSATLSADTWYFISGTRTASGAGQMRYYIDGVQDGTDFGDDTTSRGAATRMEIGGFTSGNSNRLKGRLSYHRAWSKTKNAAGFVAEMGFEDAQDTASLYANWKTQSASRFADSSGNGRDWTEVNSADYDSDFPFGGTTHSLEGASSITFGASAALSVTKPLAATSDVAFGASAALSITKPLAGQSGLTFNAVGALSVVKLLAGVSSLTFSASARLANFDFVAGGHAIVADARNQQVVAASRNAIVEAEARSVSVQAIPRNHIVAAAPRNYTVL